VRLKRYLLIFVGACGRMRLDALQVLRSSAFSRHVAGLARVARSTRGTIKYWYARKRPSVRGHRTLTPLSTSTPASTLFLLAAQRFCPINSNLIMIFFFILDTGYVT
jgi:hypothetical protein